MRISIQVDIGCDRPQSRGAQTNARPHRPCIISETTRVATSPSSYVNLPLLGYSYNHHAASTKGVRMFPDKLPIKGVYEIAIKVKDLSRSEPFCTNVLGLEIGMRDTKRNWVFLRAGGDAGMVVLQEDSSDWPIQHFAFTI